ncbi:ATP-binding cassette domain-containing protein [Bradyrhizobium elkanii]|uniref:ATP-binding cassette domain-containing protein n=1 Tax=Bradyrhizobium elkanii TaxID=29448 RepID=UPI003B969CCD
MRRVIASVPQSTDVFSGSLIENIALGEFEPEIDRIMKVCDQTGLREAIENWPGGFQAYLGENGVRLSGGEKQRLSLARALYRDPDILILTSLPLLWTPFAEATIHQLLDDLRGAGKTIVVISHRPSTIRTAEKLVMLHKGRIVAEGRHTDLLGEAAYLRLWQTQTGVS